MKYKIKIRKQIPNIRPEALKIDGQIFEFTEGWMIENSPIYPNEIAMLAIDPAYPKNAPTWIASGDLEPVEEILC